MLINIRISRKFKRIVLYILAVICPRENFFNPEIIKFCVWNDEFSIGVQ